MFFWLFRAKNRQGKSFPYGWPWGISRDAPLPPPESVRTFARSLARSLARSYADVITKFSRLDGLPIFLTHGASLARFARWSSAKTVDSARWLVRQTPNILCVLPPSNSRENGVPVCIRDKWRNDLNNFCGVYYLTVLVYTKTTIHPSIGG